MVFRRTAAFVFVLSVAAAHSIAHQPVASPPRLASSPQSSSASQQPSAAPQQLSAASQQPSSSPQQPSAPSQQPSPAAQISALLAPAVEAAVRRALAADHAAQQRCEAAAGQRTLGRLEERLDGLGREVASLKTALAAVQGAGHGEDRGQDPSEPQPEREAVSEPPQPVSEPSQQPQPACELRPAPLPADSAPHSEPARRACARSCLQLVNRTEPQQPPDGVYWLTGLPGPALCDFSHDGGGWTLLLAAVSKHGWDPLSVRERNSRAPSLTENYSILQHGDAIRSLKTGGRFAYRIEARAESERRRWGGIWLAPRRYSFIDETGSQTDVSLVRRFDKWNYKDSGIEQRMPWINTRGNHNMEPVLTTTTPDTGNWWGTLVTHINYEYLNESPWISPEAKSSGTVLYWIKEDIINA